MAGQPDFNIMGALGAGTHVTRAQNNRAIGQAKGLKDALCAGRHPVQLGPAFVRFCDRNHFDFFELVLAQHTCGVAPG